jgi:hypothetical protein
MSYLSSKKIYPGNWAEPLNGWYKNIDTDDSGSADGSQGGPTSVLAVPGYRYFQQRGYVAVSNTSGEGAIASGNVIVPSPYRQDDTRTDITGMVISGSASYPVYVYRTALSVASGWGDNRVASGIYTATGRVVTFATGLVSSGAVGELVAQVNLSSTVSGTQEGEIFFAGGTNAVSAVPVLTTTGVDAAVPGNVYKQHTAATTYKVFTRTAATVTSGTAPGWYISNADKAAGRTGYFVVEVCYIQPDEAPGYNDIEAYLVNRTVSN